MRTRTRTRTMSKGAIPIPNIHPGCKVKIIDEASMRWRTVGVCFDAPNAIARMMDEHGLDQAWVFGVCGKRHVVRRPGRWGDDALS